MKTVKPNHPYVISIAYDGVAAGIGVMPRFSISDQVNYLDFPCVRL